MSEENVRSFRVGVAAKTHASVKIVLESVMKRMADLLAAFPNDPRLAPLEKLRVSKIGAEA